MKLNGVVHIARRKDATYTVTCVLVGQPRSPSPDHTLGDREDVDG